MGSMSLPSLGQFSHKHAVVSKPRRDRTKFSRDQVAVLESAFIKTRFKINIFFFLFFIITY